MTAQAKFNLDAVIQFGYTSLARAMSTAEERTIGFYTMADNLAAAVLALRSQRVNRAFERIEHVRFPPHNYFKTLVIIIPANLTLCHARPPFCFSKLGNPDSQLYKQSETLSLKANDRPRVTNAG
jgi:hypothetical protein